MPVATDGARGQVPEGLRVSTTSSQRADQAEILQSIHAPVAESLERVKASLLGLTDSQPVYLSELLEHVLDTAGKRVRPAVTLLAAGFHPNDGKTAEIMASAVELLHVATLVHDDTVDNSDVRRGKATVSSLWGKNAAVLLGDYVFATSATFVCDTDNIRVIRRFSETIMELSSGELHEIARSYDWTLTRDEYLQRIYNKTASLFTTAAESGGVLSGAPEETVQALKGYGYNLGMAFQIVDDILDFEGDSREVGKPVGNDLAQGILTLPAIMALERYPDANPIKDLSKSPGTNEHLEAAIDLVRDSFVIKDAYAVANEYCTKALDHLSGLAKNEARESLERHVDYVVVRTK